MIKKEKRSAVLYANVKEANKKWVKKEYIRLGYSTLSEYIDALLTEEKNKKG